MKSFKEYIDEDFASYRDRTQKLVSLSPKAYKNKDSLKKTLSKVLKGKQTPESHVVHNWAYDTDRHDKLFSVYLGVVRSKK